MKKGLQIGIYLLSIFLFIACNDSDENGTANTPDNDNVTAIAYHKQQVGNAANDILSGGQFNKITVTILAHNDFAPTDRTVEALEKFMVDHLNKPDGITVEVVPLTAEVKPVYTIEDVRETEDAHRTQFNKSDSDLQLTLLYLDGIYESENVLGIAYRNTSMAIFARRIHEVSGGLGQPARWLVESSVNHHELGHLMGLVNLGTPMQNQHQDEGNGRHCVNSNCLMHFSIETGDFVDNLLGASNPPALDGNCLEDIVANGGKAL